MVCRLSARCRLAIVRQVWFIHNWMDSPPSPSTSLTSWASSLRPLFYGYQRGPTSRPLPDGFKAPLKFSKLPPISDVTFLAPLTTCEWVGR